MSWIGTVKCFCERQLVYKYSFVSPFEASAWSWEALPAWTPWIRVRISDAVICPGSLQRACMTMYPSPFRRLFRNKRISDSGNSTGFLSPRRPKPESFAVPSIFDEKKKKKKKLDSRRLERSCLRWSWNHVQAIGLSKTGTSDLRDSVTIWYVFQQNFGKIVSSNVSYWT